MSPQYRQNRYCGYVYFHRLRNQVRFALLGYVYHWIGKPEAMDFLSLFELTVVQSIYPQYFFYKGIY